MKVKYGADGDGKIQAMETDWSVDHGPYSEFGDLLTLRGAWHKLRDDPVLKFLVVAITYYGMSTFEGPMMSIRAVNGLAHFTNWVVGHVHSGALGWNGMMTFGMLYWLTPRLFQTKLSFQILTTISLTIIGQKMMLSIMAT